jgi:hypothetical protein
MVNVDEDIDQIVKYLFRAEETRLRAEAMGEHGVRAAMLRVAAQYGEMALTMERVAKGALHSASRSGQLLPPTVSPGP